MDPNDGLAAAFETRTSRAPYFLIVFYLMMQKSGFLFKLETENNDTTWLKKNTSSISLDRSDALATWHTRPWHSRLSFLSSSTAFCTLSCLRLQMTTLAPSLAKRLAIEKPILFCKYIYLFRFIYYRIKICLFDYPSVEAVTMATLFRRRFAILIYYNLLLFALYYYKKYIKRENMWRFFQL